MTQDNRKERRTAIIHSANHALFRVEVFGKQYQLERIHDVSMTGIGIQFTHEIPRGTDVRLLCCDNDHCSSIPGKIAWSTPIMETDETVATQPMAFRSGIQLETSANNATPFLMALQQYLEPDDKTSCH